MNVLFTCQHRAYRNELKQLITSMIEDIYFILSFPSCLFTSPLNLLESTLYLWIYNNFTKSSVVLLGLISPFSSLLYCKFQGLYFPSPLTSYIQITPSFARLHFMKAIDNTSLSF